MFCTALFLFILLGILKAFKQTAHLDETGSRFKVQHSRYVILEVIFTVHIWSSMGKLARFIGHVALIVRRMLRSTLGGNDDDDDVDDDDDDGRKHNLSSVRDPQELILCGCLKI